MIGPGSDRKTFLRNVAAGVVAGPMVEWMRPAMASVPNARLSDVDHIMILMQENRSFDHYFGSLSGVRGFNDANATMLSTGKSILYQPNAQNPNGYELPFRLNTAKTRAQRMPSLSHAWVPQHSALNGGANDNWLSAHLAADGPRGTLTMGYYTRDDLPFYYALADAFTLLDGYHCSVLGPTDPNRIFLMTGTNDPNGEKGGPLRSNADSRNHLHWETYPERLERAGVSWRIYHDAPAGHSMDVTHNFNQFASAAPTSALYEHAMRSRSDDALLDDIRTGNMPQVTWIVPPAAACEHPPFLPIAGENYVRRILTTLWQNPKLWSKTVFLLMYDENDGFFDHVAPPIPPPGTPNEFVADMHTGLGFRVPCMVISPFSTGGWVCGQTFDHTSVLRFIERRFGVEAANVSDWRRATCGDLTAALGLGEAPNLATPLLPETEDALGMVALNFAALPEPEIPTAQTVPSQEAGTRKRRGEHNQG
jgi:phospholipase C